MADAPKVPSLTELEPKLLQLTLDPRHVFAVWRALECYADVCVASAQLGKKAPTSVLQAGGEVHEVLSAYMRKVLGYVEDDEPTFYCKWEDGACQVVRDKDTGLFLCVQCELNERSHDKLKGSDGVEATGMWDRADHALETRHEMILHLERHIREGHKVPREAIDKLREEIKQGGK